MTTRYQGHAPAKRIGHPMPGDSDHYTQYLMAFKPPSSRVLPHPMPTVSNPSQRMVNSHRPAPPQNISLHHPAPPPSAGWRHTAPPMYRSHCAPNSPYPYPCAPPSSMYMLPYSQMTYLYNEKSAGLSKDITELESPLKSTQVHVSRLYPYGYNAMYPYYMPRCEMYPDKPYTVPTSISRKNHESSEISPSLREPTSAAQTPTIRWAAARDKYQNSTQGATDVSTSRASHGRQEVTRQDQALCRVPAPTSIPQWLDTIPPIKHAKDDVNKQPLSTSPHVGEIIKTVHKFCPESQNPVSADFRHHNIFQTQRMCHPAFPTNWIMPSHAALRNIPRRSVDKNTESELQNEYNCESDDEDFSLQMALCPRPVNFIHKHSPNATETFDSGYSKTDSPMPPLIPLHNSRPVSNESTGSNLVPTSSSDGEDRESPEFSDINKIHEQHFFGVPQSYAERNHNPTAKITPGNNIFTETPHRKAKPEFIHVLTEVHNCGRTIDALLLKFESQHFTDEALQLIDAYSRHMQKLWNSYNQKSDSVNSIVGLFEINTDFIQDYLRLLMEYRSLLTRHFLKIENHQEVPNKRKRTLPREQQLSLLIPIFSSSNWKFYACNSLGYTSQDVSSEDHSPPPKRRRYHELSETSEMSSQGQPDACSAERVERLEEDSQIPRENSCDVIRDIGKAGLDVKTEKGRSEKDGRIKSKCKEPEPTKGSSYIMEQFALMDTDGLVMTKDVLQDLSQKSGLSVKTIKRLYSANMVKNMCSRRSEIAANIRRTSFGLSEMQ